MKIVFQNHSKSAQLRRKITRPWLSKKTLLVARELKKMKSHKLPAGQELVVVLLDSPAAKKLNTKHRGRAYATDILSFDPLEEGALGELVFCAQVVERQSKENGHSYQDEFLYLLIHGILHLLGYNHEHGGRQAKAMYALQDRLFERLSVRPKAVRVSLKARK